MKEQQEQIERENIKQQQELQKLKKKPLNDRLTCSNKYWKIKVEAYNELGRIFKNAENKD